MEFIELRNFLEFLEVTNDKDFVTTLSEKHPYNSIMKTRKGDVIGYHKCNDIECPPFLKDKPYGWFIRKGFIKKEGKTKC